MADNERNTPIQDPENLENQITDSPTEEAVVAPEPQEVSTEVTEAPTQAEEIVADDNSTETETEPTPDALDVETEAVAEEQPVDEAIEEPVTEPDSEVQAEPQEQPEEEDMIVSVSSKVERDPNAIPVDGEVNIIADNIDAEIKSGEYQSIGGSTAELGEYGKFEIGVNDNGELYLISPTENKYDPAEESTPQPEAYPYEDIEPDEDELVDPEDLVIHDEVLEPIRIEGEKLTNDDESIKSYIKHSKDAIKRLESALKTAQKALEANRDDKETTVILVGIIKICGQILEIKCNNLENLARINAHDFIKDARVSLHEEVDRYNDYVITYASITGEQLTRLSTFLPENIASGKSLAVVPELSYVENYVQILPDEKMDREEQIATMVITPGITADELLADIRSPRGGLSCFTYIRKVKRGIKKLGKERARINKLITENKASRRRYESELDSLERRTSLAEQTTDEYKSKVLAIRIKYGKQLSGIKTVKTRSAFARARLNLTVNRMAVEREMLVLSYEYLRAMARAGSYSQRKAAERVFAGAITSYNQAAEITSKATGTHFDTLPVTLIEVACKGKDISFPVVAYKRKLVEKVGDDVRLIGMTVREDILPDEQSYSENSGKILEKHGKIKNTSELSDESAMVDRASAIAKVMIESLRESADMIVTINEFEQFEVKSRRAIKYFKRALKATEKAIARSFDENGVITALVENLRVIANIIEVRRLVMAVALKLNRSDIARAQSRALYKLIELYNGRAIDYMSIVGEQFSRITTATSRELLESADKIKVPVITYKDNYIEVFPKDPLKDATYEKPRLWRKGVYTPLMMHHYRLTENRAVETSVINAPFVFDVSVDDMPAVSWWHPIGFIQHLFVWAQPIAAWWSRLYINAEIWFVDESLMFSKSGLKGRELKNDKKKSKYERKLKKLNDKRDAKILALETVVHESDRRSESYQKQIYKINTEFSRKVYKLKLRWMRDCTGRSAARLLLERLVLERERLAGINKVLLKYRNYGRVTLLPNILVRYKKRFVDAITAHNKTAEQLSEMIGVKFSQVSTSVADEIIRYGKMIKFPEIVCCREVIENVDGKERTVGDRWHGYGLYTGTSGTDADKNAPVMSVGAMGYATDMGVPFLKADFDGMTMLGMTPGGVPLIGFSQTGETSIPFTGTPMMLAGGDDSVVLTAGNQGQDSLVLGAANVADPHSGISRRGVDNEYLEDAIDDAKDLNSGCTVETPLDLESKLIEERFIRALRARSMTSVDNTLNWWKLLFSEINLRIMRKLVMKRRGFLRKLLPPKDAFYEIINTKVSKKDAQTLREISKIGGIIDIECKRLYSASKTGIRRSQRVFSAWLHHDIQVYNDVVKKFNETHERYMHIEQLSLTIPDTIRFRTEDRPPEPPVFSLRNRVKVDPTTPPISTNEIYEKLIKYSEKGATKHAGFFRLLWSYLVTLPLIKIFNKLNCRRMVLFLMTGVVVNRSKRTYLKRLNNESRHYRIRYEKARNMKRYNRRTLRAIGVANRPIKYQIKSHKNLRKYLANNFRIDYNMRIRQLIYRALTIEFNAYWIVTLALAAVVAIAALFFEKGTAFQVLVTIALAFAALPIILLLLRIVYDIIMFIVNFVLLITRNIILIKYGARDVERNRYGTILDCFVTEQYRLLIACERVHQNPRSHSAKKMLIASVNDYNKRAKVYSEVLKVPIKSVETTSLIEKLASGQSHRLTEIQNFLYVRELVERVDTHQIGKTLKSRELSDLVEEINQIINGINLNGTDNQVAVDFLQGAMQRLISYIQTDIKPTQNERYELKRDLIQGISQFDIAPDNKEIFVCDVIKVVDQLGGRDSRKIIATLVEDDMIL